MFSQTLVHRVFVTNKLSLYRWNTYVMMLQTILKSILDEINSNSIEYLLAENEAVEWHKNSTNLKSKWKTI